MSFAKDLLVLILILYVFITSLEYLRVKKKLIDEREYFINTLNHDLRVSLIAQLRGFDFLKSKINNTEAYNELLEEIYKSCKYSYEMVNMLLQSYKFENRENFLKYDNFNISELIYLNSIKNNNLIKEKNLLLNYDLSTKNIRADRDALNKALSILFSIIFCNAKKNSQVSFFQENDDKSYKLHIKYFGISLTEEEKLRMYSKKSYYSTVGYGIKMQLCKKIINFHGGSISVRTKKELNLFTIVIPDKKINNNSPKLKISDFFFKRRTIFNR